MGAARFGQKHSASDGGSLPKESTQSQQSFFTFPGYGTVHRVVASSLSQNMFLVRVRSERYGATYVKILPQKVLGAPLP